MADAGAIIQKLASLLCIIPRRNRPGADLELEPRGYSVPRLIARRFARRRVRMDVDETRRRDEAARVDHAPPLQRRLARSEEHTSELQSLMRISYAVFCLKKKNT